MLVSKTFTFDAAHRLDKLPPDHKCHRLHGHTYKVEIMVKGELDAIGMVINYDDLARIWEPVNLLLDHRYLNEIPGLENPTTEHLVKFIYDLLVDLPPFKDKALCLRVFESATTYAQYEGDR